ncbi:MAG: response regulator [Chloroflexi bacterium]|nr:response regulator [Chloroflexota bacterium]
METQILRILLVDDDEDDYLITQDLLEDINRRRYDLQWVSTYEEAANLMARNLHDIYLVDYRLGQHSGLELLRWAVAEGCSAPVILMTGQGDHQVDLEAMEAGAADYLVKGQTNPYTLERTIRYAVERHRAQDERIRLEAELRQSQKMEAIGHMAGGIAHDFNNVLTAILSYASLARRYVEPDHPVTSKLIGIEESSQRAANLTHQLLAFARRQVVVPRTLNLNDTVLNLDRLLRRLINADIELVTLPDHDLDFVKVDPGQVEQVLVNLVVNARDAMPNGGKLTIRTANEVLNEQYAQQHVDVLPGHYVCLSVSDTGAGMTGEVQARIFDPFFTTKEPGRGTGLGLATCYGIVKQNEGHIQVESVLGEGTVFKIFLPQVPGTPASQLTGRTSSSLPEGEEMILVVEDEPAVRQIVTELLEQQGYSVITAVNGEDALRLVEKNEIANEVDLLLTDIVMPRLTGTALADKVKTRFPQMKIVFMSGYADESLANVGTMESGITFIQKPFTMDVLVRKIRQVLDS